MKFNFNIKNDIIEGNVIYSDDESTFEYIPNHFGDISILIGYLNLMFDSETKRACQIWGFSPKITWIRKELIKPASNYGDLILEEDYDAGDNIRMVDAGEWITYYDEKKELVCVGNEKMVQEDIAVEFVKDIIIVLRNNNIISVWFQIKK